MAWPTGNRTLRAGALAIGAARLTLSSLPIALVACGGQQSAPPPAGAGARDAALVMVLLLYAVLQRPERRRPVSVDRVVVGGGIALPVVALSALLAFGLKMGSS